MESKRKRIGNDLRIKWTIHRGESPEDFKGKNLDVQLMDAYGGNAPITYTIDGNVIVISFAGKDQKRLGAYNAILYENRGELGMVTLNHKEVVVLVQHSEEEGGEGCSNVTIEDVQIGGCISVPERGPSNYELAVAQGFTGTVDEYLASLKGEKGDKGEQGIQGERGERGEVGPIGPKGDNGDVILPKFSVNEEMELVVDTDVPTDRFSIENGNLIINI